MTFRPSTFPRYAHNHLDKLNGVFAVDKPSNMTSAHLVNLLKPKLNPISRVLNSVDTQSIMGSMPLTKKKIKIGHGGTLDPIATGVLVIGLGSGTKALNRYLQCTKEYTVSGILGSSTTTYDCQGTVDVTAPYAHITRSTLEKILPQFRGLIMQRPPLYSALKRNGVRFYDLARRHENNAEKEPAVPLPDPRPTTIYSLQLLNFSSPMNTKEISLPPEFTLQVECSKGTYIRSLVHDIGLALHSRAHVIQLRRTRQGEWDQALALTQDRWCLDNVLQALRPTNANGEFLSDSSKI